ncbi:glycoside hydrolase family 44-domain-containing protein [Pterulicium gracile]|uniref:Glycoside hydrolase family 44-domain-containing protein n=1 Tax=Pterulicium gracile TaxID=1884261 RepID=A0A5C3QVT0_9AGAR|nr:glycoside hydrolase family 44-domain-containing protein [Pterula gracilis]
MVNFTRLLSFVAFVVASARADLAIYTDSAIATGWDNWSWNSEINFTATDVAQGTSSISITSQAWSAASFKSPAAFTTEYAGLKFDYPVKTPDISISFADSTGDASTPGIPLSQFPKTPGPVGWNTVLVDFAATPPNGVPLPEGHWDRINFQAAANGATYHLDNISLVSEIVVTPKFLSAEPLGDRLVAVTTEGPVDFSKLSATLNGKAVSFTARHTEVPADSPKKSITYFTLGASLSQGTLVIKAGDASFSYALPAALRTTIGTTAKVINPLVYGVNWPPSASYIKNIGVTASRWGGNAVSTYNPQGDFTNAGSDWFFQNRGHENADEWVGWVKGAGSATMLTIPGLDWVSKDSTSYSFSRTEYPNQQTWDPYNADSGNGRLANGTFVTPPPDPKRAYTPWTPAQAKTWLAGMKNKPTILFVDNEIEIASETHHDVHPELMGYDEELKRVLDFSKVAKEAQPNVQIAAPSTCSWWFYWTSVIGYTDNAAHGGQDFVPWFLDKMRAAEKTAGKRLLDWLDLHYYYQPDTSADDAPARAKRLRMTRSLWDPTYVDESWIGENPPQSQQPDATKVQLIPRIKALIEKHYPGTKYMISEWAAHGTDVIAGLVTVDSLGIFGKFGLDAATYWVHPPEGSAVATAYWLFRGYGTYFGTQSLPVTVTNGSPDLLGVYAAKGTGTGNSLVVVNKDPSKPLALNVSGLASGNYFIRHFGGGAGVAKWQTRAKLNSTSYIVVPAYTALFLLKIQE